MVQELTDSIGMPCTYVFSCNNSRTPKNAQATHSADPSSLGSGFFRSEFEKIEGLEQITSGKSRSGLGSNNLPT